MSDFIISRLERAVLDAGSSGMSVHDGKITLCCSHVKRAVAEIRDYMQRIQELESEVAILKLEVKVQHHKTYSSGQG